MQKGTRVSIKSRHLLCTDKCLNRVLGETRKQTPSVVSFCRLTEVVSSASNELEKSKQTIKWLQEQQQSAQEFLNMKHFAFNTDSKLERFVDKFTIPFLFGKLIFTVRYIMINWCFFPSCFKTLPMMWQQKWQANMEGDMWKQKNSKNSSKKQTN